MNRSSSYRRHKRYTKINRKKNLVNEMYHFGFYKFDGQYDKGKIHCSCPMCAAKWATNGPDIRDLKKIASMDYQVQEESVA